MKYLSSVLLASALLAVSFAPLSSVAAPAEHVNVLIGFHQTPGHSERALVRAFGGDIAHSFHLVSAVAASVPKSSLNGLRNHPLVAVVEEDGLFYAIGHDAELNNTWGVKHIGAGQVHHGGNTGAGVRVAVLDTGIASHPDLSYDPSCSASFVSGESLADGNGHGTHVSGTVAALKNGFGVVGVGPDITLCALKVLSNSGSGSFSNVIAALQYAVDRGDIKVTNNSYGSSGDPGTVVRQAFDNAYAAGILHIAAAGNSGNPRGTGNNVGYPARYASVVAVAATDQNNKRASWSSTGPDVELSAPGVSIRSTLRTGGYGTMSGTSMASPHVAGVAALVIAAGESDISKVRQILRDTAKDLGASGKDNLYGYGLVQAIAAVGAVASGGGGESEPEPEPEPDPEPPPPEEEPAHCPPGHKKRGICS